MKKLRVAPFAATALLTLSAALPARAQLDLPRPSPKQTISQRVGLTDVSLAFSRPGVKGRPIWGTLVPYDQIWRTGANEATTLTVSDDVTINGQKLPAGTWAVATIPARDQWTVVFNKDKEMTAATYKKENDVLRITVKSEATADNEERMSFSFPNVTEKSTEILFRWEKLRWKLDLAVDTDVKALASARAAVGAAKADDWRTPYRAANWCFDSGATCPEMNDWADKSMKVQENYQNVLLKAKLLKKQLKTADAVRMAERAIKVAKETPRKEGEEPIDTKGAEQLLKEWAEKK